VSVMDMALKMEIEMPQDEQPAAAQEVTPLPDFLTKLAQDLRANEQIDKDLIAILETQIINVERHDKSGAAAANAIEQLAARRVEGARAS
jgi:hypothetical protein